MPPVSYQVEDHRIFPNVLLAPMEGVTDVIFRRLVRQIGGCGLTTTEFVPSLGLSRGDKQIRQMVRFDDDERPVAIQIFGRHPAIMAEGARVVEDLGATFVDINMGCPSKKVCAHSGGSALMREPELAVEIVRAVRAAVRIPVTVKMRSGFDPSHKNAPELAWRCQEEGAAAVAIHWRTREDHYGGVRDVRPIAEAKARVSIPVIANGDIVDVPSALAMFEETGCDGVMIGRGAMKNPWVLRQIADVLAGRSPTRVDPLEKQRVIVGFLEDQRLRARTEQGALGRFKGVAKHFFDSRDTGAREVRMRILRSQTIDEAKGIATEWYEELARRDQSTAA